MNVCVYFHTEVRLPPGICFWVTWLSPDTFSNIYTAHVVTVFEIPARATCALQNIPCLDGPYTTMFWRRHCWFSSTVAWERDFSVRATPQRSFVWGCHLPLLFATWITRALKPLLLSFSKCSLCSTRRIPHHVLWTWSCCRRRTPSFRRQQPSPC